VLKLLAEGRDTAFVAAACGLTEDKVSQIAAEYGYPDDPARWPGASRSWRGRTGGRQPSGSG
jgi:hypothetical protein